MRKRGLLGKLAVVGIGGCLLLVILDTTFGRPSFVRAQSSGTDDWEKAAGGNRKFDVASVKEDQPDPSGPRPVPTSNIPLAPGDTFSSTGGLFRATHWPLVIYISFAYKLTPGQLYPVYTQLPKWAQQDSFDIEGHSQGNLTKDQYRLMMQSLLSDRFKLALHTQTSDRPVFALVLSKSDKFGPQLRRHTSDPACPPATAESAIPVSTTTIDGGYPSECDTIITIPGGKPGVIGMGGRNITIAMIGSILSNNPKLASDLDRPVIDGTGLTGTFDFRIDFALDAPGQQSQTDQAEPTLLEALKDQLGLKLEHTTAPVQNIIIDHIEELTSN